MITDQKYAVIADKVYDVDKIKTESPARIGNVFKDKESTGKFQVLKTVDTNDPRNSHGYDANGFQGMAVAPVNNEGKVDYSHIIVAYAGTNQADHLDVAEDFQGIGGGNRKVLAVNGEAGYKNFDSQFKSALKFYQQVHSEFPDAKLDTTGHSLGGAMALFVASHFQVRATVFSAPDPWKVMTSKERLWALAHPDLLTNYRHHGDPFSGGASTVVGINGFTGTTVWSETTANGPTKSIDMHMLNSFKFDNKGRTKTLRRQTASDADLLEKKQSAIKQLIKSFKSSGGQFTHAEKIAVDSVKAASISNSLTRIAIDGISGIIQHYNPVIDEFEPLWQETIKSAELIGEYLSHAAVMAELERAGVTHQSVVDEPIQELEAEIKAMRAIGNEYLALAKQTKAAVDHMMATDTELARMFNHG